jgi:transposase
MVPSGACQIDGLAGSASFAGCAQAASGRLIDVELSIRGILRGFGLKIGVVTRKGFEARVREPVTGQATLEHITRAMLSARSVLKVEYEKLHKSVLAMVRENAVCRRLMTAPGVGPLVAMTYKSAIDDPSRITKSKAAGALFGLTPKKYQSGEKDITGGITRTGDEMVRTALYEAANVWLSRITRFSKLKRWGLDVAKRRGSKRAEVALAQERGNPASNVDRWHNVSMERRAVDGDAGMIRRNTRRR